MCPNLKLSHDIYNHNVNDSYLTELCAVENKSSGATGSALKY